MARVVHFEIRVDDVDRAINFYQKVFGWNIEKWKGEGMDYWMIMTGPKEEPGIDGGMYKRPEPDKGEGIHAYICTVSVEDIDKTLSIVEDLGGKIAVPKSNLPGVGEFAQCIDTEGNFFGLMKPEEGSMM